MTAQLIDTIEHERDFKRVCDGILIHLFGYSVQTYAGKGGDEGADAEWRGELGDSGVIDWVFQYKFRHPAVGDSNRRQQLLRCFRGGGASEFRKQAVVDATGYVLMTNVPLTRHTRKVLRALWTDAKGRDAPLLLWDPSTLDVHISLLQHLTRIWSDERVSRARREVVQTAMAWARLVLSECIDEGGLWPVRPEKDNRTIPGRLGSRRPLHSDWWVLRVPPATPAFVEDPQFQEVSGILFPTAFRALRAAVDATERIHAAAREVVEHVVSLTEPIDALRFDDPTNCTTARTGAAWFMLVNPEGWVHGHLGAEDGRVEFSGFGQSMRMSLNDPKPTKAEIDAVIDSVLASGRGSLDRSAWERAKADAVEPIQHLLSDLWYPAELGIDAPADLGRTS